MGSKTVACIFATKTQEYIVTPWIGGTVEEDGEETPWKLEAMEEVVVSVLPSRTFVLAHN
jgi:hypothetical protein